MRNLTKKYWTEILQGDKGLLFEDLTRDLLKSMYPDISWLRTSKTHDGKKDFHTLVELPGLKFVEKYWVECKMHNANISINKLSPTLVMAILEKTRGVIIFSYSPINSNAIKYLSQFSEIADKKITPIDDLKLEEKILAYPEIVNKYFPDYDFSKVSSDIGKLDLKCSVKFNRDVAYDYNNKTLLDVNHKGTKTLQVNETFCIDIFLRNLTAKYREFELKLFPKEFQKTFSLLDHSIEKNNYSLKCNLNPDGLYFKRLIFRFEQYRKTTDLPSMYIFENGIQIRKLSPGKVNGNWIINAPLIGSNYLKTVDQVKVSTSHRNSGVMHSIVGESGTGKSRLMKEIKDVLITNGYRIHSEDGDFQSERSTGIRFLRKVVSELTGLPLKSALTLSDQDNEAENNSVHNEGKILDLLYSDDYSLLDSIDEASNILFELISTRKTALLVDNVQFYDEDLVLLMYSILHHILERNIPIVVVLSFNTDFLYPQTKCYELVKKIQYHSRNYPNLFFCQEINGFTEGQVEEYIEHCIEGITDKYPETLKLIIKKTGKYPLFVEQALHLLYQKEAIKKRESFFYIADPIELHNSVNEIPKKIYDLIALRWHFITTLSNSEEYVKLVKIVTLFQQIPEQLIYSFNIKEETKETLTNLGILEQSASGRVSFHHAQILSFFNENLFFSGIDHDVAIEVLEMIERNKLQSSYSAQYFIVKNKLFPTDPKVLKFGVDCLLRDSINQEYRLKFAKQLYTSLSIVGYPKESKLPIVVAYTRICDTIKKYDRFSNALNLFKEVYEDRLHNYKEYLGDGESYYYFVRRYVNSFLSTHKDYDAQKILLESLAHIDEFRFESENSRKKVRAQLLNRLCVTYKSLNYPERAESVVDESIDLSKSIGDTETLIKNYIDKGYIYYKDRTKLDRLIYCWDTAWQIFDKQYKPNLESRRVSAHHHKSLVELCDNKYENALYHIKTGLKAADRQLDTFNKIKLLLTETLILKLSGTRANLEEMVQEAIDLSARHQSIRSLWTSWHLLGKVCQTDSTLRNSYLNALESLSGFIVDTRMEKLYQYFFDDVALVMRNKRYTSQIEIDQVLTYIKGTSMKKYVETILKMKDDDFNELYSNYIPITPINDGKLNYPCP